MTELSIWHNTACNQKSDVTGQGYIFYESSEAIPTSYLLLPTSSFL